MTTSFLIGSEVYFGGGEGKVEEEHKTRMRWMAIIRTEVPMGIFLAIVAG